MQLPFSRGKKRTGLPSLRIRPARVRRRRFLASFERLELRRVLAALPVPDAAVIAPAWERAEGENAAPAIGGTVWSDRDGDGVQAAGEPGLPGVDVSLFDPRDGIIGNGNDVQVGGPQRTTAAGEYLFSSLAAGSYYVQFTEPADHAFTPDNQGSDETIDSDANRNAARDADGIVGRTQVITVTGSQIDLSNDAGLLVPDRFEQNDTLATAAELGVLPGVHLAGLSRSQAAGQEGDDDFYQVELLRPVSVQATIRFVHAHGDLALDVLDASGAVVGSSSTTGDFETVTLPGLNAGTYFVRVWGAAGAANIYSLSLDPMAGSSTRVFYVNDGSRTNDFYSLAVGDDNYSGLSPDLPKASVQAVLADYDLGPSDLVVIDTGQYTSHIVSVSKTDEGATYAGAPHTGGGTGSDFSRPGNRWELVDADFNLLSGLTFGGGGVGVGIHARSDGINPSTNNQFRRNHFGGTATAIQIDGGGDDLIAENTVVGGGSFAFHINQGASVTIRDNTVTGRSIAAAVTTATSLIDGNDLSATSRAVQIGGASSTATVSNNVLEGAATGLKISSSAVTVWGNEIRHNGVGVESSDSASVVYGNNIHDNTTGIYGFGTFGGADWSAGQANQIHHNETGISARDGSTVRFNRVFANEVGVQIGGSVDVHHNLVYRNSNGGAGVGVLVDGGLGATLVNNTVYAPDGHGVDLRHNSRETALRNNIIWTESGYALRVETDSQVGFRSDYNNLFATGSGRPVFWQKEFVDLFDWQVEADFDSNSIGLTEPHPTLDHPHFINLAGDDYRLTAAVSTGIDAGHPDDAFDAEPAPHGGRINLGAYGNTPLAASSRSAFVEVDAPNFYTDLQADAGQTVIWHTFDTSQANQQLAGTVDIDLYEEGVGKVADIAIAPATVGSVGWTPSALGISGDTGKRYRLRIASVAQPTIFDISREPFSIVPDGSQFYVDDGDNSGDEFTPAAIGNNRHTGQSPSDPKAVLLSLLRSYDLGPGDTVNIDTGNYTHVRNAVISGTAGIGDDEGATFVGPSDLSKVARLDRANGFPGSTNIELNDADFVTLRRLTLIGAEDGLVVRNGSTNFTATDLTAAHNSDDGLLIAGDSDFTSIDRLTAHDNGGDGIQVATSINSLTDSSSFNNGGHGFLFTAAVDRLHHNEAFDNGDTGFHLLNQLGLVFESNEAYRNQVGIFVNNSPSGSQILVGNADLAAGRGNKIRDNARTGVAASGNVLVAGNTVSGQTGSNGTGISLGPASQAVANIVHSNFHGIASSGLAEGNRVYNNSQTGIRVFGAGRAEANVVYSNSVGVQGESQGTGFRGLIGNNLVYGNGNQAILVEAAAASSSQHARVSNNTVFQQVGDALRIQGRAEGVQVRNNILWTAGGYSLFVAGDSQAGIDSDYNLLYATGSGQVGSWQGVPLATLVDWQNAGFTDAHSISQDPLFVDRDGADDLLGFAGAASDGRDDDFHLMSPSGRFTGAPAPVLDAASGLPVPIVSLELTDAAASPAIDRGDANFAFSLEPPANGGYINLGAYGNTELASKSPPQFALLTKPDGGEVWPAEQTFPIRWRSDVITPALVFGAPAAAYQAEVLSASPVGYWHLNDAGDAALDSSVSGVSHAGTYENGVGQQAPGWLADDTAASFDGLNDRITVADHDQLRPATVSVEAWVYAATGIGDKDSVLMKSSSSAWNDGYGLFYENGDLVFFVNHQATSRVAAPLALDRWTHVAATYDGANLQLYVNGSLAVSSPLTAAINHSAGLLQIGQGIGSNSSTWTGRLDEVSIYAAALTAAEVNDHYHAALGTPTFVNIELQRDGDAGFKQTIASNTLNDGELSWTIPNDPPRFPPHADYRIRVTRVDDSVLTDTSNSPFAISPPINNYYVNAAGDTDFSDNEYTTAAGNDALDGLSPATPKASISAVLQAYDLDAGDTILVDSGTYTLSTNILLEAQDAGVLIKGPTAAGHRAILDRANVSSGSYAFELDDADGVTLSNLSITGAQYGVYASADSDSDQLTITDSEIFGNSRSGVWLRSGNDQATIAASLIHHHQGFGVDLDGERPAVTNSTFHHNASAGIDVSAIFSSVVGNTAYLNNTGIVASGEGSVIDSNVVFENETLGIAAFADLLVSDNRVFGHEGTGRTGIRLSHGARATGNTVYDNFNGIQAGFQFHSAFAEGNRVFDNHNIGIWVGNSSQVAGNTVYSNQIGIQTNAFWDSFSGSIENNVVYANAGHGVVVEGAASSGMNHPRIANNSVYQPAGDAIRVQRAAEDVELVNNILWSQGGANIHVDSDSQQGFASDYNLLHTSGAGRLANWGGTEFTQQVDWFYELGFDGNSRTADPVWQDADGADNILGWSTAPTGAAAVLDDEDTDTEFAGGGWSETSGGGGFQDDYWEAGTGTGANVASWTFSSLTAGATYQVAATWKGIAGGADQALYRIFDDGSLAAARRVDQRFPPDDFADLGATWETLTTVQLTGSTLTVRLADDASGRIVADAVRIQQIAGDGGPDDDFHLRPTSPAIDSGSPATYYLAEPMPSGDRANQGAFGNTAAAATSPAQMIQVLSPNGFEKLEQGQQLPIEVRSSGLSREGLAARMNVGGPRSGQWLSDRYRSDAGSAAMLTSPIDVTSVTDPAPEDVYRSYSSAAAGEGNRLSYSLPAADGAYTVTLHFAEPAVGSAGTRVFDVWANGIKQVDDFDIFASTGTRFQAATLSFPATAVAGLGIQLELVNQTPNGAVLSGLELTKSFASGVANPTAALEVSTDRGASFAPLITNLPLDRFGRATYSWTAGPVTVGNTALVRVQSNDATLALDISDEPFLISNGGSEYYVNIAADANLLDNEYSTAAGANSNSGKSPQAPMASLSALLFAYDLDPGDSVFVDPGRYVPLDNILIGPQDAGVTIRGPAAAGKAILDRANTASGSYVFELVDADHVTLSHLSLTGAEYGLYAGGDSDSDHVTITGSEFFGNRVSGLRIETSNEQATVSDSALHGHPTGIESNGGGATVRNNRVFDNDTGISVTGPGSEVLENEVFDNWNTGISAFGELLVRANSVRGHDGTNDTGILLSHGAHASGNTVYENFNGIQVGWRFYPASAANNRVYHNRNIGIWTSRDNAVTGNTVYANSVGIEADTFWSAFSGRIENNLVYANRNQGIVLNAAASSADRRPQVLNNTVFQEVGDAVLVQGAAADVELANNILWSTAGFGIHVASDSQRGFRSDYNLLHATAAGQLANWGGHQFARQADWFYALGFDGQVASADPLWADRDGTDGVLGYNTAAVGAAVVLDDEDAGMTFSGGWTETSGSGGFLGDYWEAGTGTGSHLASWTFSGLSPGSTYEVAATWQPVVAGTAQDAAYRLLDGGGLISVRRVNQRVSPGSFSDLGVSWEHLTTVRPAGTTLTVQLADDVEGRVIADAIRIQQIAGDGGADDDFHLLPGSPGIDTGSPGTYHLAEPQPNGGRTNLGAYGNTSQATASLAQLVQVVSPNGFEKLEQGQAVEIELRSSGLSPQGLAARTNAGGSRVGTWLSDRYRTDAGTAASLSTLVDPTLVADPAPASVYQSFAAAPAGVGQRISYAWPVSDGTYGLTLHFAEPFFNAAGARVFDVLANGNVLVDDFDIVAVTGTRHTATALGFQVSAAAGAGITLELVNESSAGAILSGIELTTHHAGGTANHRVRLELSTDSGGTYTMLAADVPLDRFGRATRVWTAGPVTPANTALLRTQSNSAPAASDVSDAPFLIANSGADYYVNTAGDTNTLDNEFTTAPGANSNSGKSPAAPMASLASLIAAYDLGAGDTVFVDTGSYTLLSNLRLTAQDAGVTIRGASRAGRQALLDRANTAEGSFGVELVNADGVTLDALAITGGIHGVYAAESSASDQLTITNSEIFANTSTGVLLRGDSDDTAISQSLIHDNGLLGLELHGDRPAVHGNTVFNNSRDGVTTWGATAQVTGNTVFGNRSGITVTSRTLPPAAVRENTVYDNAENGIWAEGDVLVTANHVYGHAGRGAAGIWVRVRAQAAANRVHDNYNGMKVDWAGAIASGNRVYNNGHIGISAGESSTVQNNFVYSNSIGIQAARLQRGFDGRIENNLVYANTNQGIVLQDGWTRDGRRPRIANNTVFQEVGDAVRVQSSSRDLEVLNNLLWVDAGYGIYVAADSQTGFTTDRNIFTQGSDANAHVGYFNGATQDLLADWQAAHGQAGNSLEADPQFVDRDGADNVLGFTSTGGGFDGGPDDNFNLAAGSPAIDRADSIAAAPFDLTGVARVDDPGSPNLGTPDYFQHDLGANLFTAVGAARNFHRDDDSFNYRFPAGFIFEYFGETYDNVFVSSNGFLQFGTQTGAGDSGNTFDGLLGLRRVAPLWDDLSTLGAKDVYIDESLSDRVTIRWDASNQADGSDVNVAVTLWNTGRIEFHYGAGNTNLTPTVGISRGDQNNYVLSTYSGRPTLAAADSIAFDLSPGVADLGAFEFQGSSSDTVPPTVVDTKPAAVHAGGATNAAIGPINVTFSEIVNTIDANAPANYELRSPGANQQFGDADDVVHALVPAHTPGSTEVTLSTIGAPLGDGLHRLTLQGDSSIHDLAGNRLNGGTDYVRTFRVDRTAPRVDIVDVQPDPRRDAVSEITVQFTEAVRGFELSDLVLSHEGGANLLPGIATLTSADQVTWTLGNLNGLTQLPGGYQLSLVAAASGVVDAAQNRLDDDAVERWSVIAAAQVIEHTLNGPGNRNRSGVAQLLLRFSQPVTLSGANALQIFNQTTGAVVDVSAASFEGNGTTAVSWNFPASFVFADGYYTATLGKIEGLAATHVFMFHVLRGDSSGNGRVDFADFGDLATRFNTVGADAYGPGDLNGDGNVSFADFSILASNFNRFLTAPRMDFGDAPESGTSFATTLARNGARHVLGSGPQLGPAVDGETDGQPDTDAAGDGGDEDGVAFAALVAGATAAISVEANIPTTGVLNAWLDFNGDGNWDGPGEQVFVDRSLNDGSNNLNVTIPASARPGPTYARFRITAAGGYSYAGLAPDGEVEDYLVTIVSASNRAVRATLDEKLVDQLFAESEPLW